jgi:hypothetical protein
MDEIRKRYQNLPQFKKLLHMDVNVTEIQLLKSGHALARSSTVAEFLQNDQSINKLDLNNDYWEFIKVHQLPFLPWTGHWKIKSFSFK